jgi:hypothetical protein
MMNHDFGMQWSIPISEDIHRFRLHKINIRLADTKDTLKKILYLFLLTITIKTLWIITSTMFCPYLSDQLSK